MKTWEKLIAGFVVCLVCFVVAQMATGGGNDFNSGGTPVYANKNLADVSNPQLSLANLVAQPDNTAVALAITNGMVQIGSANMGVGDGGGSPQVVITGNGNPLYDSTTNVVMGSKENIMTIVQRDRTQGGYISWSSMITNPAGGVVTSPYQDAQLGLSGDLYSRRLLSPFRNFDRVLFLAFNAPIDFAFSSTAHQGTNSGTWCLWYVDNTNNASYFGQNGGGASPRDPNYHAALRIDHTTGRLSMPYGYIAPPVLFTNLAGGSLNVNFGNEYSYCGTFIFTNFGGCNFHLPDPVAHDGRTIVVKTFGATALGVNADNGFGSSGGLFGDGTTVTGFSTVSPTFMGFSARMVSFTAAVGKWWVTSNVAN